jgi:hypothetical protein
MPLSTRLPTENASKNIDAVLHWQGFAQSKLLDSKIKTLR